MDFVGRSHVRGGKDEKLLTKKKRTRSSTSSSSSSSSSSRDRSRTRRHAKSKDKKERRKKRKKSSSSSSSSSSSFSSSSSSSEEERKKRKHRKHKKDKKKKKKKLKKEKKEKKKKKSFRAVDGPPAQSEPSLMARGLQAGPSPLVRSLGPAHSSLEVWQSEDTAEEFGPVMTDEQKARLSTKRPLTKEEYEARQSVIRRVLDPETGRTRLVRGEGEIIEEIVSRERHKDINKQATSGDGNTFQRRLGMNR